MCIFMKQTKQNRLRNDEIAAHFKSENFTWKSIKDAISPDAYKNPDWIGLMYFLRDMSIYFAMIAGLILFDQWYIILPLWMLSGFVVSGLFIVGHDAAHGALFRNKRLAWWVGQISMLPSLHAYEQWAYGHNRVHHGHTIKLEGDFVWRPVSPTEYKQMNVLQRGLHRLYWSWPGSGIYYLIEIWLKGMVLYSAPRKEARRDKWIIHSFILLVSAALIFFGGQTSGFFSWGAGLWMWTRVMLLPFIMFNYFIGLTVYVHHIHEDIPWKKHGDWSPAYGQLFGTINYHINPFVNFFMHNIFIHMPHHVQVRIPFYNLPRALNDIRSRFGNYVVERKGFLFDYLHSTRRCKLFDPASGAWMTYREANSSNAPDRKARQTSMAA